ncbi:MAG: Asp/Glu/hydantoin racemase, partial [Clostridiaceae bacterium]|nr:Asp/Glu/hydantoin racemase [Clostridiaceae bacterium]
KAAEKLGKKVEIRRCLVEGALDVLMKEGNKQKHNGMVLDAIEKIKDDSDVIVLAQGSMTVLLPHLTHIKVPVLSSPRSGVTQLRKVLEL